MTKAALVFPGRPLDANLREKGPPYVSTSPAQSAEVHGGSVWLSVRFLSSWRHMAGLLDLLAWTNDARASSPLTGARRPANDFLARRGGARLVATVTMAPDRRVTNFRARFRGLSPILGRRGRLRSAPILAVGSSPPSGLRPFMLTDR